MTHDCGRPGFPPCLARREAGVRCPSDIGRRITAPCSARTELAPPSPARPLRRGFTLDAGDGGKLLSGKTTQGARATNKDGVTAYQYQLSRLWSYH
eukprot:scaffold177993_cov41-Tisochrysis_lutea.AAC.3